MEEDLVKMLMEAVGKRARAEAFLDAAELYCEIEQYPDRKVLIALLTKGDSVPEQGVTNAE